MTEAKKRSPRAKLSIVTPGTDAEHIAASTIQTVPLALLNRAAENVRHTDPDSAVEGLADDIAAHGLLQSLIGYRIDGETIMEGAVWIVGGGRRLQALNLLLKRGNVGTDFEVPVLIRDRAEAVELSLAENLARRDMNPADEFVAFRALLAPGTMSPADLAKRFGFTDQYIKQRLRLASLAPAILDGIRAERISLTSAYAYAATADTALQMVVFEQQEKSTWQPHAEHSIRQAYINLQATTENRLFKFVGAEAYEAAGGGYDDDLFSASDDDPNAERRLDRGDLLTQLAADRIEGPYADLIAATKAEYATLGAVDLCPGYIGIDAHGGKMPPAPKGMKLIQHSWDSERDIEACLAYAVEQRIEVSFAAGLNRDGVLELITSRFYVPADKAEEVQPQRVRVEYNYAEQEARREAERLEASIMGHAVRLAAAENRKNNVEGRTFWKNDAYAWKQEDHEGLGPCYSVTLESYVTVEEAEKYRTEGQKLYEAEQIAQAERRAAHEQAVEQAKADRAKTIADMVEAQPLFVAAVNDDGVAEVYERLEDGSYASIDRDEDEDSGTLEEALGQWGSSFSFQTFQTREEVDAAFSDENNAD